MLFQNLIPYVRQMVFAYISIEGWIIHPDVNSFFYDSDEVLVLSPYNAEVLDGGIMYHTLVITSATVYKGNNICLKTNYSGITSTTNKNST